MDVYKVFKAAVEADDAAGAEFIGQVVYDFMADFAELHRQEITDTLAPWALDRVMVAKRALGRSYVESTVAGEYPDEGVHKAAEWLVGLERFVVAATRGDEVSKGFEWFNFDGTRKQVRVNRDARGRFARGINQNPSNPMDVAEISNQPNRQSPSIKGLFKDGKLDLSGSTLTPAEVNRHQAQWDQATNAANELKAAYGSGGSLDGVDLVLTIADGNGDIRVVHTPLKDVKSKKDGGIGDLGSLRPSVRESILSVELAPGRNMDEKQATRLAAFNMLGGAGGSALAELAFTDEALLRDLKSSLAMPDYRTSDKSALSRVFGVLESGGRVLEGVSGAERLGQAAHLIGVLGPQAEEVLGPYVKRSAYRYRGTETTPPVMLRQALASPDMQMAEKIAYGTLSNEDVKRVEDSKNSPMTRDALRWAGEGLRGDSLVMQVRADEVSAFLAQTLPQDTAIAELSQRSGQVLPSQGIIIDAEGKIVSQSVGFTDDHYLPFDLANLGRLRGGQYVRTRQQGGLTGEDIYTAVMTGARQVQVVSSSGVFTLEFASDFRGARGNSDKARGMYDRYLKILDAVDASGMYLEDISPVEQATLRDQARKRNRGKSDAEIEAAYEVLLDEKRREMGQITTDDVKELTSQTLAEMRVDRLNLANGTQVSDEEVIARMPGGQRRAFDAALAEKIEERRNMKANRLRLNAEGYEKALQTLQAQFPYFIQRTNYMPLGDLPGLGKEAPMTRRFTSDQGYARPGALRANGVMSGFYNGSGPNTPSKPRRGEEKATAPAVGTDGGPQAPQSPQAPKQEDTKEVSQPAVDTFTDAGVAEKLNARREKIAESTTKKVRDLSLALGKIARGSAPSNDVNGSFDAVADSRPEAAWWLISNMDSAKVRDALSDPKTRLLAAQALADEEAMSWALKQALGTFGGEFAFNELGDIGGAKNQADATRWLVGQGKELANLIALQSIEQTPSGNPEQDALHRGAVPLALPGIRDLSTKEDFDAYAKENPATFTLARDLALTPEGEYEDIVTIGDKASKMIDAMIKVDAGVQRHRAEGGNSDIADFVDEDAWDEAFQGLALTPDAAYEFDLLEEANIVQEAWNLAAVGRALEVGLNGGDVFPKGGTRLFAKAAPRVRVLGPESALAAVVASRVAKGLEPVPAVALLR